MASALLEETVLSEDLLDAEVPCTHDRPAKCQEPAAWVRVCPRCHRHRFRCEAHYRADLNNPGFQGVRCIKPCNHWATWAEVTATFRPV